MVMLCEKIQKGDLPIFLSVAKGKFIAEEKEDGDRVRMRVSGGKVTLTNRRGREVTFQYPEFAGELEGDFLIDGEMCVIFDGVSQFNEGISFRTHCKSADTIRKAADGYPVTYVVFDVIEHNGKDLRNLEWTERRAILESLNLEVLHADIKLTKPHYEDDIMSLWTDVVSRGGEGIILKDVKGKYLEGKRSSNWRKVKDVHEVDLTFTKFEKHNAGITVETTDGIRCTINGSQSDEVQTLIETNGECVGTINHLGNVTKNGKYRQPTWKKVVG